MSLLRRLVCALYLLIPCAIWAQSVSAESAIVIDSYTGKVLFSKNADVKRYPASTTKIMTGMLLVEHCQPDDIITAPDDIENVKEASMHLKPGERIRAKDMLYAIMLRSANDGCYATAMHIAGSIPKFAEMMNNRAKELGCKGTHFANANGLHDDEHYTTARDLALIAREAMKNPWFRDVVKTWKVKINRGTNWKDLWMVNHDKYLRKDTSADGIKTGWTIPAGRCFVGSATRNDWRAITVVMKSKDWQDDNKILLDWAFKNFKKTNQVTRGAIIGQVAIKGGEQQKVNAIAAQDGYQVVTNLKNAFTPKLEPLPGLIAPIKKGDTIGEFVLRDVKGFEYRIPAVADTSVSATKVQALVDTAKTPTPWILGGFLVGITLLNTKKRRSRLYGNGPSY